MRFLCDENITQKATKLFKKAGHDVETVQSLNFRGITNSKLIEKSVELERILVTFDTDFA